MKGLYEKVRKELRCKRYLDTVIHISVATILYFVFFKLLNYPEEVFLYIYVGAFFPDIDHLLLYRKKRFGSFKNFLKWIIRSERYRIEFELFHNTPVILIILLSLPYLYLKNKLSFVFFLSFLLHLLSDLVIDRIAVGEIKWWRFGI